MRWLTHGRRFRIRNVVDDVTRECLAAVPDTSISGKRVACELTTLIERRGKPSVIVFDHGTEFTSNAILAWAEECQIEWHYIAPGKPMQNGYFEFFNWKMRDERRQAPTSALPLLPEARRSPTGANPASRRSPGPDSGATQVPRPLQTTISVDRLSAP